MGSPAVMAQKARSVDNILQIKAGKKDFEETNMSVVTSDGAFYSFIINYATAPSPLNISFVKENSLNSLPVQLTQQPLNEAALEATAKKVLQLPAHFFIPAKTGQLKCNLANLLVDTSSMWFSVRLYNSSQINFKPDYLHFSLRDRHQSKRTALQETTLKPIYQSCPPVVSYKTPTWFVFAFKPFTIPPSQRLIIQIGEQSGGRILTLRIKHKALLKATAMVP
jgi:conjugative transposon TraN protein